MPPLSRRASFAIAIAITALIGLGDQVTGADVAFTLLYAAPIALGSWYAGQRAGVLLCLLATLSSMVNALLDHQPWGTTAWNELGVLVLFLSLVYLLSRHREHLERERQQHALTVDQLRHADRLNVIGTLAAGVAHEIGTPLNVISGNAELIVRTRNEGEIRSMASTIRDQTDKISAIIRHLLDFGRRAGVKKATLDLGELARSAATLLTPIARKRDIVLVVEPGDAPVEVRGNLSELEQVVSNLVLNAIQAMDHGKITLRVGVTSRPDAETDTFGAIIVEDEGPGIGADVLPHIFEPFFTTKGVGEGTGLGLSVSYGIVRDHGGSIEVESTRGRGARFTVLLPRAPREALRLVS